MARGLLIPSLPARRTMRQSLPKERAMVFKNNEKSRISNNIPSSKQFEERMWSLVCTTSFLVLSPEDDSGSDELPAEREDSPEPPRAA